MKASKPKLEILRLDTPIWNWAVTVLRGDRDLLIEAADSMGYGLEMQNIVGGAIGHTWVSDDRPILIWVKDPTDRTTMVHEVMHAVFGMLEGRGLRHCSDSEEAYTYTVSYLLEQIERGKWRRL